MLSKNKIKYLNSLKIKKYRDINQHFIIEGDKIVSEIIDSNFEIQELYCTENWYNKNKDTSINLSIIQIFEEKNLKKIASFKSVPEVIAVVQMPEQNIESIDFDNELILFLDEIQDPGNLGTIIRTADWFGIKNILCTKSTVDLYNPKVLQSTMGAFCRVNVHYNDINFYKELFKKYEQLKLYGTFLEGKNIYKVELSNSGIIVIGNEGKGISQEMEKLITDKLFIPNFSINKQKTESLNAAVATAIACSEFRKPK